MYTCDIYVVCMHQIPAYDNIICNIVINIVHDAFSNTPTRSDMLLANHFPRQMLCHRQNKEVVPNLVRQRTTKAGHFSLCICPFPAMHGRACMVGHGRACMVGHGRAWHEWA